MSGYERPRAHRSPSSLKHPVPVAYWVKKLLAAGRMYEITVLEQCTDRLELANAEQFYIAYFRAIGARLLNITDGGEGCSGRRMSPAERTAVAQRFSGKPLSSAHRERLSIAAKRRYSDPRELDRLRSLGRNMSQSTRDKMALAHRGTKYTAKQFLAHRNHWTILGESRRGVKRSPETIAKMSAALRNPSPETRAKLSYARRNRPPASLETRNKMSAARRGKRHTEETKKILSLHWEGKRRCASDRAAMRRAIPRMRFNLFRIGA